MLLCTRMPYIINRLIDTRKAPKYTKYCLRLQYLSIKNPTGIFKAHGMPAQKPIEAMNAAERLKKSLIKKIPTILVNPDIPAEA